MSGDRVVIFLDEQNLYRGARRSFFGDVDHHTRGNCNPVDLGSLLTSRKPIGNSNDRILGHVRVYTGVPLPEKEPIPAAAHQRRIEEWRKLGAKVTARPLRYLSPGPGEQKGVDVALAIDLVDLALDNAMDVGIICSEDTDLHPAVEFVLRRCPLVRIEFATWWSDQYRKPIRISGHSLWHHRLTDSDYKSVCDHKDYSNP